MDIKINWILALLVIIFVVKISLDSAIADKNTLPQGQELQVENNLLKVSPRSR